MSESTSRCGGLSEQSSTSSSGGLAEQSSTSSSGKPAEQSSTSSSGKPAEQSTTLENDKQQHTEQLTVATPSIAVSDSAPSIAISDKTSSTATTDPTSPSFVLSDPPPKDASTAPATIPDDFAKIIDLDDYPILEYPVNSESEFTEDDEDEKIIKMHSTTNATMRNHYICFPWMKEYYIRLKTVVNAPSSHKIRCQLIKYYCEQCVTEFSSRNIKAVRAGQLARNVRENLVIFHRWPREVSSPNADYSLELSKLLTVYIDLELKASMRGTETIEVVTDRICLTIEYYLLNGEIYFTLYALLHNSRCHKTHRELLTNVFEHVLTRLPTITSCNTPEKTVVMYIAAFRTWYELLSKKGTPDEPGKKQVIAKFKKIMKYDIRFLRSTKYAPRLPGLRSDPPNLDVLLNNVEVNFLMRLIDSDATISNPTEYCDLTVVRDDESDVSERFPFTKSPQPVQNSSSSSEASHTITHSDSVDQSCIIEVDGDEPVLARPTPQTEEQDGPWEYSLIRDSVKVEIPANMVDKTIDLTGEPAGFSYLLSFMNSLLASAQVLKKTRPTKTQCSEIIDVDADDDDDEDCAILPDSLEECSYISNTIPELTTDVTNHDVVSESNSIVPAPPSPDSGCSDSNNEVRSERYKHIEDKLPSVVIEAPSSSAEECSDMEPSASFADDSDTDEGLHPSIADETTEKSIEKVDLKIAASSSAENSNESSGMGLSSSDIDVNISVEPTDEGIDSPIPSVTTPLITVEDRDMQVDVTLPDEIIVKSVTDAEGDNSATKCDDMVVDIVENKKSTIPELMPIICKPKTNELIVEESMDKDETDDNAVVPCLQIQTVESISLSEYQQWLGKPPDLNAEPKPPDVEHTDDAVFDEMQCDEIDKEDNIESSEQLPNASPTCDETNDEEMPLIDDICVVDMKYKSQRTYTNKKTKQSQSTSNLQSQVVVHSVDIVKSPHPSSFATCSQAFEASSMESRKISGVESSTLLDTSAPILNSIEHNVPLIDMPLQQNESKSSLMVTSKFIHSLDPNSFEETDDEYDEMVCEENGKVTPPPTIEDEETVKEIVGESSRTLTLPPSNVEDTNMDDEHEANELVTISTSSNIADRDLTDDYEEIVEDSAKAAPPPSTIVYRANKLSVAHDFSDDEMSTDAPLHASPANANVVFRASALLPESDPPILDPLNSEPGPSQTNRQSGILKKRSRTESPKREHNVRFNPEAIMTDGSDIIKVGVDTLKPVSQIQVRKASKSKGLEKMTAPTSYRVAKAVNTTSYRLQTKEGDVTMQDEAQTASELNRSDQMQPEQLHQRIQDTISNKEPSAAESVLKQFSNIIVNIENVKCNNEQCNVRSDLIINETSVDRPGVDKIMQKLVSATVPPTTDILSNVIVENALTPLPVIAVNTEQVPMLLPQEVTVPKAGIISQDSSHFSDNTETVMKKPMDLLLEAVANSERVSTLQDLIVHELVDHIASSNVTEVIGLSPSLQDHLPEPTEIITDELLTESDIPSFVHVENIPNLLLQGPVDNILPNVTVEDIKLSLEDLPESISCDGILTEGDIPPFIRDEHNLNLLLPEPVENISPNVVVDDLKVSPQDLPESMRTNEVLTECDISPIGHVENNPNLAECTENILPIGDISRSINIENVTFTTTLSSENEVLTDPHIIEPIVNTATQNNVEILAPPDNLQTFNKEEAHLTENIEKALETDVDKKSKSSSHDDLSHPNALCAEKTLNLPASTPVVNKISMLLPDDLNVAVGKFSAAMEPMDGYSTAQTCVSLQANNDDIISQEPPLGVFLPSVASNVDIIQNNLPLVDIKNLPKQLVQKEILPEISTVDKPRCAISTNEVESVQELLLQDSVHSDAHCERISIVRSDQNSVNSSTSQTTDIQIIPPKIDEMVVVVDEAQIADKGLKKKQKSSPAKINRRKRSSQVLARSPQTKKDNPMASNNKGYKYQCSTRSYVKEKKKGKGQPPRTPPTSVEKQEWIDKMSDHSQKVIARDKFERRLIVSITRINIDEYLKDPNQPITFFSRKVGHNVQYNRTKKVQFAKEYLHKQLSSSSLKRAATSSGCNQSPKKMRPNEVNPLKSVLRPPAPDPHASVPKTIPAPAPKTKSAPESTPALVTKPAPIPAPKINAAPEPTPAPKTISTPNQKPKSEQTPAPHSGGPVAKKVLSGMEKYLISFNRKFGITDSTVQPTERKSRGRRRGNNQNSSPRKQTASQSRSRKVKQDERRPHVTRPRRSVVSSAAVAQQPVASSSAQLHATTSPSVQPLSRKHKSKSRKSNFKSPEYYIRMDKRFGMKVETRCTQMNFSAFLQCTTECEIDSLRKPCAAEFLAGVASEPYEAIQEIVENTFKFCKTNVRYEGGLKPLPPPIYENVSDAEEDTTVSGTPSEYPVSNSICNTSALWCNVWGSLGNYTCQNTDKYKTDLHVPYGPLRRNLVTVRRYTLATVADERNRPAQPDILNLLVNSDLHLKQMPHSKLATFVKFLISWKKISPIEYNDDAELVGKFIKLLPHKNGRSKLMEEVSDAEQNILILLKGSIPELQQMPDSKLAKFVKLLLSTNKIPMIEYSDDGELVGQFIKFLQNKKWDKLNETNLERCVVSEDSETEASIDEVDDDIFTPAATDVHIDEVINEEVVTLDNANNIDMDPVVEEDAVDETVYKDHFNDTHEEVVSHEEVATSETQQSSVIQRMEDDDEAHHLTYDHQSLVHPDMEDDSQVSQHRVEDNLMFVDQTVVICENGNELDISQTTHNSIIAGDDYVEGVVPPIKETDHTHSDEFILEENSDNSELFESKSNHEEMQQESVLDTHDNAVYEGHDSDEEDAAPSTMHQYVDKSNPPSPSHFNSDSQPSPDYEKLESNLSQLVTSPKRPIASDTPDIGAEMECGESGNSTQVGTFTNDSYFFVSEVQHREEGEQVAPNNEIYHHLASQDDPTLNPTVIDLPTERITDLPTESIIDLPTEPITDPPTESIIELPTESIIVQPTKPIIDLPLERRTTTKKQKDEVLHANQCLIDPYPMALSQQPTVSVIVEPKKRGRKRKESDPTMCAAVKPKRQRKPAAPRAPKAPRKTKAALKKEAELNALIQQSHLQYVTYPAATSSIPTTQLYNNASLQQSLNAVCSSFASVNPIPSTSKRKPGRPTKVTKQLQSYNTFVPQLASASFLQGGFPNTSAYTQLPVYHTVTSNPMYRNDVGASSNQVNYASTRSTTTEVPTIDTAPSSTSRRKRKPKASQPIVGCPVEAVATGSDNREMTESPDLNFRVDKQGHRTYSNQRIASVFVPQELVQIIEGSQNAGGSDKLSVVPTTAYDAR